MRSVENKLSLTAGICAAASGLFLMVPVLNAVTGIVAIAFLTLVIARLGFPRGILVTLPGMVTAAIVSSLTMGYQAGLIAIPIFLVLITAPSFMMGRGARKLASPFATVAMGLIPLGLIFAYFLNLYVRLMSDLPLILDQLYSESAVAISRYPFLADLIGKYIPLTGESAGQLTETTRALIMDLFRVLPGIMAIGIIGAILCSFLIAGAGASKFNMIFPRFRPFYLWRASGWWLPLTILGLAPMVLFKPDVWFYAGLNILILTGNVYLIVGLSIVESYFRRSYSPGRLRLIFYAVLVLLGIFAAFHPVLFYTGLVILIFLVALGLTDSRFNFKRESLEENND